MIALLTGQIACRYIDHLVIDVGGVGYRVAIPLSTFYALPESGAVRLHVHTHVKEDAIHLYGFLTPGEKEMFILLLTVSGVGPKLAVNILSNISVGDLQGALAEGNGKRLAAVPGIGKKTAERLILELREKTKRLSPLPPGSVPARPPHDSAAAFDDALSALLNLGYKESQAKKTIESLDMPEGAAVEDILKSALKILMK